MPLLLVRNDITAMKVDAIVNAANPTLLGGGGVDGCIHRAAGPLLLRECRTLGGCRTGEAKITGAYRLPCRYVIHTVGPVWHGGRDGEDALLARCYRSSLMLAAKHRCETVAFPLISSGIYGYPKGRALRIARDAIRAFLTENEMTVYLVIFGFERDLSGQNLFPELAAYLNRPNTDPVLCAQCRISDTRGAGEQPQEGPVTDNFEKRHLAAPAAILPQSDESFSEMLQRKIAGTGMTDVQCCKNANADRNLFSEIRGNRMYKPSKPTALAFAIALELSFEETGELLRKAGFALTQSAPLDLIVGYFIGRGNYNIDEINEALFAFDQSLLGA